MVGKDLMSAKTQMQRVYKGLVPSLLGIDSMMQADLDTLPRGMHSV